MADDTSESSYMLLGVYSLISYQAILNTYGVDFLETCLQFIASTLAEVNPENIMIARIAADSFAVVYIFPEEHNGSTAIWSRRMRRFLTSAACATPRSPG